MYVQGLLGCSAEVGGSIPQCRFSRLPSGIRTYYRVVPGLGNRVLLDIPVDHIHNCQPLSMILRDRITQFVGHSLFLQNIFLSMFISV